MIGNYSSQTDIICIYFVPQLRDFTLFTFGYIDIGEVSG